MRLAFHILKKDIRRLWWEIIVAMGALAYLAHMDANRMDSMAGPMEGLMNLVVPAAWAYIIAMVVHQDVLVGDRQFWVTRPYPRLSLLAAKLLFVLCFIHLPAFLFDAAIIRARGFNGFEHLAALLSKQVKIGAALTLPAFALAAVTKNLAQFASFGLVCVVAGYLMTADLTAPWLRIDSVRRNAAAGLLASGAVAAVVLQYSRRRVIAARTAWAGTLIGALLLTVYVPTRYTTSAGCRSGRQIRITRSERHQIERLAYGDPAAVAAAVPISVTGAPANAMLLFEPLEFTITNAAGEHWTMPPRPVRLGMTPPQRSLISPAVYSAEGALVLWIDRGLFGRIAAQSVHLRGTFAGTLVLSGTKSEAAVGTPSTRTPGLGRCANFVVQNTYSPYPNDMVKAVCEWPDGIPRARVEFIQPASGKRVRHGLGDAGTHVLYPTTTWLSPVHRRTAFFHITDGPLPERGAEWIVARSELNGGKLEFTPQHDAGCSITRIDLPGIDLRRHLLEISPSGMLVRR